MLRWAAIVALALLLLAGLGSRLWDPHTRALALMARHAVDWRTFCRAHLIQGLGVFVVVYAAAVVAMLPVALLMTALSGFLFGLPCGAAGSVAGSVIGAAIAYGLGRWTSLRPERHGSGLMTKVQATLRGFERDVFTYTLSLRLMPLTPFTLISLAAGVARARIAPFLLGTTLGVLPECIVYPAIGAALTIRSRGAVLLPPRLLEPSLLAPLAGLAVLSLAPILIRRVRSATNDTKRRERF